MIDAYQLPAAGEDVPDSFHQWCDEVGFHDHESGRDETLLIQTLEGVMEARPGDWIIKGVAGEFYPCKPDIFEATYEAPGHQSEGVARIATERRRQVEVEGWTPEHDDKHDGFQLVGASLCYLLYAGSFPEPGSPPPSWPWEDQWWKPHGAIRNLERAGALIAAEIDRLLREEEEDD